MPRLIDAPLQRSLEAAGAVVVEGARATGKTMTGLHAANSYVFIDDIETQRALEIAPRSILEGQTPRLLDEWQVAPELWNLVRRAVDGSAKTGQFILTGSAVPPDDVTRHTGAGRFIRLRQRTMTWWEKIGPSGNAVSLAQLFQGARPTADLGAGLELDQIIDNLLRPGFPAMTSLDLDQGAQRLVAYMDDVSRTDIQRLADIRHEPSAINHLIAALACSTATEVTYKTLAADVQSVAPTINQETISHYVQLLQRLFIVELQRPWTPQLRSRATVRTSPKLHLVDPALAAAAMRAGPAQLSRDLESLGFLFESAVIHDLTAFAATLDGEVRHYRDSNGHEIDAIVTLPDGRWAAVEIKLGGRQATNAVESLDKSVRQIDTSVVGEPAFRLVVTGTGPLLTADDDTVVCPLNALAP